MSPKMDWWTERAFRAGLIALATSCALAGVATLSGWLSGTELQVRTAELFRAVAIGAVIVVGCMTYVWLRSADDRERDPPAEPVDPRPTSAGASPGVRKAAHVEPREIVRSRIDSMRRTGRARRVGSTISAWLDGHEVDARSVFHPNRNERERRSRPCARVRLHSGWDAEFECFLRAPHPAKP